MGIHNLQPLAYAVSSVTFLFGMASVLLRLWCRATILKTFGWDDVAAVVVLFVIIGQQIILYMFLHFGCGMHVTLLTPYQIEQVLKWLFIEEVYYYFVHWIIKSAFLLFYLRLSPKPIFRTFVYVGMGLNAAFLIINWLLAFLQCMPFDEILHPGTHPDAVCISKLVLLIVPSILNIIEDFYILILPISTVWSLQMSLRRKIAVLSVIGFGASSVLVSSLRLIPLFELNSSPDVSFVLGKMVIVAAVEIQLAVVAVNLPSLKALWMRMTGGSSSGSGQGYSGNKGYKLSSMERGRSGAMGPSKQRSKQSRGSITMMENGLSATESEEELFRRNGQGQIKVTTNVNVSSMDKSDKSESPARPFGRY